MKKWRTPVLLCAVALLCAFLLPFRTRAATWNGETVYYTVVNDTMLDLSYSSMPASVNGTSTSPTPCSSAISTSRAYTAPMTAYCSCPTPPRWSSST